MASCRLKKIFTTRDTECKQKLYFCRTGRRRSGKSLSPAGSQTSQAQICQLIDRYLSFAVVSRQRKRIDDLCFLRASSEAGGEISLLQYLLVIRFPFYNCYFVRIF